MNCHTGIYVIQILVMAVLFFKIAPLKKIILPILFLMLALISCNSSKNDKGIPLARVDDIYLYDSDLKGLLPPNTATLDSIVWVRNYTNNWVKTELLIKKAKENLKPEQIDFDKQLEKYRNSLITYTYESELIKQQLDTAVSGSEIESYYLSHQKEFVLVKNIVRAIYVVIDNNKQLEKHFTNLFSLPDSIMLDSMEYNCKQYARKYFLDTATWLPFDKVLKIIPAKAYNQELFLQNNRFVEIKDKHTIYMIKFVDFKIKNDFSPLQLEEDNIKNIIINSRKIDFIKALHERLYKNAEKRKEFEIYTYDK